MDWDDDDEKTTVFDRSNEESAQALLQKSPSEGPAADDDAEPSVHVEESQPAISRPAPPPAPPLSSRPTPAPSKPAASKPAASRPSRSDESPAPEPTQPRASAPAAPAPRSESSESSGAMTKLLAVAALALVALAGAWALLGGSSTGSLVVAVAGPGGKAVDDIAVMVDGEPADCEDGVCEVQELEEGSVRVKVTAPGYANSAVKVVKIVPGDEAVLNVELVAESPGTGIRVTSDASGVSLKVDGKEIGPLPQTLTEMKPGMHQVEVSGSSFFEPFQQEVKVVADEILDIEADLELKNGNVTVERGQNAKGAKIYLIGGGSRKPLHRTKLPIKINLSTEESYRIEASRDGHEDFEEAIEFSPERPEVTITVDLVPEEDEGSTSAAASAPAPSPTPTPAPQTTPTPTPAPSPTPTPAPSGSGKININSIPVSNVLLDGKPLGTTPKVGVSVSAGAHTVVFVHPQYGRKQKVVTVPAGGTATAAVRFP